MNRRTVSPGKWPFHHLSFWLMIGFLLLTISVLSAMADDLDAGEVQTVFVDTSQAFNEASGSSAAMENTEEAAANQTIYMDSGQELGQDAYNAAALGDLDGDKDLDAVLQGQVYLNNGGGTFTEKEQAPGFDHFKFEMALADVDSDDDLDLISATPSQNEVWLNDGTANFSRKQTIGSNETWALAVGDVDDDGDLDIIFANANATHKLYLNNGSGKFNVSSQNLGNHGYRAVALADVDDDGDLDAFFADCTLYTNNGSGKFSYKSGSGCSPVDPASLVMGDIDGDNDIDAIIGSATRNPNLVMKNNGSGNFSKVQNIGSASTEQVTLSDIDLDGDLDLFCGNTAEEDGDPADRFWLNDGKGNFSSSGQILEGTNTYAAIFGDGDNDGDPDLLVGTGYGPNKFYINGPPKLYMPYMRTQGPDILIPDTTEVIDDETMENLSSISEDGSVFVFSESSPLLDSLEPGEVMVGGTSDAAPNGFLRKVSSKSMNNGKVVVETEFATLREAITHGELKFHRTLKPSDIEDSYLAPGVTLNMSPTAVDTTLFDYTLNHIIYDQDGNHGTTNDQVRANGRVALNTEIDFDFDLGWPWEDSELIFTQTTSELAQLEISYASGFHMKREIEIARHRMAPITVQFGPFPVVFTPMMTIYVGVDGAVNTSLTTRVDQSAALTYGVKYDGDWHTISSLDNDFSYTFPQLDANLSVKGYAGTSLSLLLYGVVGPSADLRPFLLLNADVNLTPWWILYGGLEVGAGVKIDIFGIFKYDYYVTIYDKLWPLAQADTSPPTCYQLSLYHTGMGSDPVANPNNSSGCSPGSYLPGEYILLGGAVPHSGWKIASWTNTNNNSSTSNTNTLTMPNADLSAGVNYTQGCYTLNIGHTGMGTDPVATPTRSTGCSEGKYTAGENIKLSNAVPDSGWEIESWSGTDNNSSTSSTNWVTMPGWSKNVLVNYSISCYALTISHTGMGTNPSASPSHSSGCPAGEYLPGQYVQLSGAVPDSGWEIESWSGTDNDSSTASTNSLTMPSWNKGITVNYTENCHKLTLSHTGNGTNPTASPNKSNGCPAGRYITGANIQLSGAVPDPGWEIESWTNTNNDYSTASTNSVTMPGKDTTARVNYSEEAVTDPVTLDDVYTTDCAGNWKTTFNRGDDICLHHWLTNHTSETITVYLYWDTWDPYGGYVDYLSYYGHMVDLDPGSISWYLEKVVESSAAYGTYQFSGKVEYPSGEDIKTTTFKIQS